MTSPLAEYNQRLREIDPLLPDANPLTGSAVDLLVVDGGIGAMICNRPDPASLDATWSAAEEYRLTMRVTGPAAIDALLTRSAEIVRAQATPDDPDSEVVVWWPSRDVVATAVFLRHGMSASRVVAVRTPRGGQVPVPGRGVRIAGLDDLDASVALQLTEVRGGTSSLARWQNAR